MKKLLFLVVIVLFFSCKENMPVVPPLPQIDSARKVLVEEFTGVGCVQCPSGSIELENLLSENLYGENLVVVSIHAGDFSNPLPESTINFQTTEGEALINYLGNPAFYPSAVVDRKDFDGGSYRLQAGKSKWAGFIAQELAEDPKVTVNISKTYEPSTRKLSVQVFGLANEALTGELRLTVMISESNIVNAQLDDAQGGLVLDYVHNHAFRTTMTNFDGDAFATQMNKGDNYDVTLGSITLPEDWKSEDCEIIAFVNLIDGQSKEVLQVESAHVED